ncbi:MAG: XisI protein [Bacteroidota bacterium]
MDKLERYGQIIRVVLEESAVYYKGTTNPLTIQVNVDEVQQHYQLVMFGWDEDDYIYQCLYHIDVYEEKVWIQWNSTDFSIEEELLKLGIPASDIVLGLKHPEYHQFTDFAVA